MLRFGGGREKYSPLWSKGGIGGTGELRPSSPYPIEPAWLSSGALEV